MSTLYICYLGIEEPLVQTQVIPYLEGLASAGYGVVLLTFEPRRLPLGEREARRELLRVRGIEWHALRYHKRPALPATLADIAIGTMYAAYLIRTRRVAIVHARGHVPAAMAVSLQRLMRIRFVFDIRGLMAEEYVDAGLWRPHSALFRLVKRVEDMFLSHADVAVVLTQRALRWLSNVRAIGLDHLRVEVIPCCVDLRRFHVDSARTRNLRSNLGFGTHPVLVYAGKFGGWYMPRQMTDFFDVARRRFPDLRFLVLTQSTFSIIEREFARRGVTRDAYRCLTVPPEQIPEYLALADFAICFITPCFSKIASSPTKMGEYLAAGLPVVYNSGIGDLDDLEEEDVGAMVTAFSEAEYDRATRRMQILLGSREVTASKCQAAAERHFSLATIGIPRYVRVYAALTGQQELGDAVSAPSRFPRVTEAHRGGGLQ